MRVQKLPVSCNGKLQGAPSASISRKQQEARAGGTSHAVMQLAKCWRIACSWRVGNYESPDQFFRRCPSRQRWQPSNVLQTLVFTLCAAFQKCSCLGVKNYFTHLHGMQVANGRGQRYKANIKLSHGGSECVRLFKVYILQLLAMGTQEKENTSYLLSGLHNKVFSRLP